MMMDPITDEFKTINEQKIDSILFLDKFRDPDLLLCVSLRQMQDDDQLSSSFFTIDSIPQRNVQLIVQILRVPKNDTSGQFPIVQEKHFALDSIYVCVTKLSKSSIIVSEVSSATLIYLSEHSIRVISHSCQVESTKITPMINTDCFAVHLSNSILIYNSRSFKLIRKLMLEDQNIVILGDDAQKGRLIVQRENSIHLLNPSASSIHTSIENTLLTLPDKDKAPSSSCVLLSKNFVIIFKQYASQLNIQVHSINGKGSPSSIRQTTIKETRRVLMSSHFQKEYTVVSQKTGEMEMKYSDYVVILSTNTQMKVECRLFEIMEDTSLRESQTYSFNNDYNNIPSLSKCITFHHNEVYYFIAFGSVLFINKLFPR